MKTVMKGYFGSHLYGTSTPESDVDFKEIFIPHPRDILMGQAMNHTNMNTNNTATKNSKDDIDHELFSLKYFFKLAAEGETVALDMLHTPDNLVVKSDLPDVWKFIQDNRSKFYTTDMKAYLGYVRKQAAKYGVKGSRLADLRKVIDVIKDIPEWKYDDRPQQKGINERWKVQDIAEKLPLGEFLEWTDFVDHKSGVQKFYNVLGRKFQTTITIKEMKHSLMKLWDEYGERARKAEANEGIDWKALSHAYRAGVQLKEIYTTGDLVFPLREAGIIKLIKSGEVAFKEVQELLEDTVDLVETLAINAERNGMRKKVDMTFWDNFIEKVYLENHNSYYGVK
ncbi:thioredoxin [Serratia phage X20]|uniref:Thioredoxin n=1 Tax=Serratia phage X20 TaxID=2006942 RepID=A0A1Z1LZ17_9CAUD|nr:nucleotidyltransferase [Serratia phage X20]ARW58069.1 thioredoxin [Serratia phage X20]